MDAAEKALAHCEISNLLSRYYQALDLGDLDTLEREVMDVEATWILVQRCGEDRTVDESSGRDAVIDWFRKMLGGGVSMTEGTVRHFLNTHVIEVEGDSARSRSHLQAVDTVSMAVLANGIAEGEHVRTPEGWRIRRYRVEESITEADMAAIKATFHSD